MSLVSANIDILVVLSMYLAVFINTELFIGLNSLSSLMFYVLFILITSSFGICFCITWVLLHYYFCCFSRFQLPYCVLLLFCLGWHEMKILHIITCSLVLVIGKQANVHCIYSPIVSRFGTVFFFFAVRMRFMLQSRVFEGHTTVKCCCCFGRQL